MSCQIATWLAQENGHQAKLPGSVAASDAFFPFPDGPSILMDAGVTAIIQPGGSKRDDETIKACNDRDVDLVDWGVQQGCVAGPSTPIGFGCDNADLNGDGHIDLKDVHLFWMLFTGAL